MGRPNNKSYPIRDRKKIFYIRFEPIDGLRNPETGYLNCDGSPIKSLLIDKDERETKSE